MMTNNFDTLKPLFSKVFFYHKVHKGCTKYTNTKCGLAPQPPFNH